MNKTELSKLPKSTWPKIVEDVGKKFYSNPKPDKHLAPGLVPHEKRGAISPLSGTTHRFSPMGRKDR
jgi:hypothetical protein